MKLIAKLTLALLLVSMPAAGAQLYRWVDEKGNVEWRDTPPPAGAKQVEQRTIGGSTISTATLPYTVQQAMKNFPVTLWITNCGDTCDRARAHLARRGVPYTEKNARAHFEEFKKAAGDTMEVPLLFVGNTRLKGYLGSQWDAALDTAGYPHTPPIGYKPPPPAAEPPPQAAQPPSAEPSAPPQPPAAQ